MYHIQYFPIMQLVEKTEMSSQNWNNQGFFSLGFDFIFWTTTEHQVIFYTASIGLSIYMESKALFIIFNILKAI